MIGSQTSLNLARTLLNPAQALDQKIVFGKAVAEEAEMTLTVSAIDALADAVTALGNLTKSTPKRKAPQAKEKAKAKKGQKVRRTIFQSFLGCTSPLSGQHHLDSICLNLKL